MSLRLLCGLLLASAIFAQQYDLLIRGGHVIDSANNVNGVMDVAVTGDKIAAVGKSLPGTAKKTLDASGFYVTPGLVDLHVHVFGYSGALLPDSTSLVTGTTTVVDCGGAGWRTFEEFKKRIIDTSQTRVLSFLNIVGKGMVGTAAESNVEDMDPKLTADKIKQYPGLIVGIKVAHFSKRGHTALRRGVEAGKLSDTPVIVDSNILTGTDRDPREKLLEILRPGDIHTHMYNDRHLDVVNRQTLKLTDHIQEARRRGILFDLGHGGGSFLWPVAVPAMKQNFSPDTISTDLHSSSIMGPQSDMPNCISKMMLLGMPLEEAIAKSTVAPAKAIRKYPEIGTLGTGKIADIGIFEIREGTFAYKDAWGMKNMGTRKFEAAAVIRAGRLVYDKHGLGFPEWQTAGDYKVIP